MQEYVKKILPLIFIISVLSFFIFLGINYTGSNLASFSSIITAWVTINPLHVDVIAPSEVEIDKVFQVKVEIENRGEEKVEEAKGKIFLPEEIELIGRDEEQEIGILPPQQKKFISWSVKGKEIGNYVISVKVSGELQEQEISKTASTMVEIKEKTFPGRRSYFDIFKRFFNLFSEWFRF